MQRNIILTLCCVFLFIVLPELGCAFEEAAQTPGTGEDVQTPSAPLSPAIFPCSNCHDGTFNATRRQLKDEHTGIIFEHGKSRWCLDCHNPKNRDKLRLASGELVDFAQSYKLCGQCHGPTFRDWKVGVHGKRTGMWNGKKKYFLCVHCHNPHSPRIKPLTPFPAPKPPKMNPFWGTK